MAVKTDRRGAVAVMFALTAVPMVMAVGLAVDYSFFVQAQSQLTLAADAAAIHAVRIASSGFVAGQTAAAAGAAGALAGHQWFDAQLGVLSTAAVADANVTIPSVTYDAATSTFTSAVTYSGVVPTHFGGLFNLVSWPISGGSNAVITTNSFVEIVMLLDNSSSMLIGATQSDILAIENLTVCAPAATASAAGQPLSAYSWSFASKIGYGAGLTVPGKTVNGTCDSRFTGGSAQCPYPVGMAAVQSNGYCPAGTGVSNGSGNVPQAPCGLACHTGDGLHDYYTLARHALPKITLRFDVVQTAAATMIGTMQAQQQVANQFSLGVYEFNTAVTQVHPSPGGTFVEADTNLAQGLADVQAMTTPVVNDSGDTDFPVAAQYLAQTLAPAGAGTGPDQRRKALFIVTDGMEDYRGTNGSMGPMTNPTNETTCAPLKALGFNIFVLYTPYYPLPNPFYLDNSRQYAEPTVPPALTNPIIAALQACASNPDQFYQASSSADITAAMQQMLLSALNTAGRISR